MDPPADQKLLALGRACFIQLDKAAFRQIGEDRTALHIGQNGAEHGVAVRRADPCRQLFHIEAVLFLIVRSQIAQLIAKGVGASAAGPSGGFLGDGNDDFGFFFPQQTSGRKSAVRLQRDLQVGICNFMCDRRQYLMAFSSFPDQIAVGVVGLHGLLQQPHQITPSNSARPEKLPSSRSKIFISISRRGLWRGQSSGRRKVITPFFITGYQKLAVIFPWVPGE